MTHKHSITASPFIALKARWSAAVTRADRVTERIDQHIASMPEALRENWSQRPQYSDYGVEAAEHELDAATDRLNAAEHAIIGTPATSPSDIAVKLLVARQWARLIDDDPEALDWIFDTIADDFARLADEPAIAA